MAAKPKFWIKSSSERMAEKGTKGAFGKATPRKIAAGKAAGGVQSKRATFAENMARFSKRKAKRSPSSRRPSR